MGIAKEADIVVTHVAFLRASESKTCEVWYNEVNRMQVTLPAGYGVFSVSSRNAPVSFLPQTIPDNTEKINHPEKCVLVRCKPPYLSIYRITRISKVYTD